MAGYLHLLDGGVSDNIGLRGPARSLLSTDGQDSILGKINLKQIKKVVVITVNSKPGTSTRGDKKRRAPGIIGVLSTVTTAPMNTYSLETIDSLNESIEQLRKDKQTETDVAARLKELCPDVRWPERLPSVDFYNIELNFDQIKNPTLRVRLKGLGTNYHLQAADVELLKQAARDLLRQSETFGDLIQTIQ